MEKKKKKDFTQARGSLYIQLNHIYRVSNESTNANHLYESFEM